MPSVFHYTDTAGLLGILESESLFATDYRYLNDASEGDLIRSHIMPIFEAEIGQITQTLISKNILKEEYYKELGRQADVLQAEKMYAAFVRVIDNVSPFFVLSFCRHQAGRKEHQHGLLSQWRGYGGRAGFAIEFDEDGIDTLAKVEQSTFVYAGFKSDNVEYNDFKKVFNSNDYEGIAGEMIWQVFDSLGKDVSSITGRKNIDAAVIKFAQTAPFLKHWGFHEEAEYRIVLPCLRPSKIPDGEKRRNKAIKYRRKNDLIIPYIELFDEVREPFPIKSIIVGPHALQARQVEAVKMVLETNGLDVEVRSSEIPLRN